MNLKENVFIVRVHAKKNFVELVMCSNVYANRYPYNTKMYVYCISVWFVINKWFVSISVYELNLEFYYMFNSTVYTQNVKNRRRNMI